MRNPALVSLALILALSSPLMSAEEEWVTINEGFLLSLPKDWKKEPIQGEDSHVGKYHGKSAYLSFDEITGLFERFEERRRVRVRDWIDEMRKQESNPKLLKPGQEIWHVDGRIARFSFAKVDPAVFGKREYPNVASIFVPYDVPPRYGCLTIHLFYAEDDFLPTVRRILRSVSWPIRKNDRQK